jgi:peptidoglycan/LPS O-acetylase OafA/YrhL
MTPTTRLNSLLQRNRNSLDFIRFAAAVAVIFSHSYPYALGSAYQPLDPLWGLTNHVFTTGMLAVAIFFIISGFLVAASMERSGSAIAYVKARFLRIYPGLFVLVLVTIFVLGPLVTTLSPGDYFRQAQTYEYFQVLLLFDVLEHSLPGVFVTNAYPLLLNGSLWTLFWEMLCYLLILLLWLMKLLRRYAVLLLWIVIVVAYLLVGSIDPTALFTSKSTLYLIYALLNSSLGASFLLLASYFFAGTVFYLFRDRIVMTLWVLLLALGTLILCLVAGQGFKIWFALFSAYLVFYAASSPRSPFMRFGQHGDFSYGLYIYAPLVQQSLVYVFGGKMEPMVNFVFATPITLILAVFSWKFIEKPALKLKDRTLRWGHKATISFLQTPESKEA